MVHDIDICKECHCYKNIENYSCKERHCRKCENYGERLLPADVRIIQRPVEVKIECPHCFCDIEVDYSEFTVDMGSDYPEDWEGIVIECPYCNKNIEIDEVEWI